MITKDKQKKSKFKDLKGKLEDLFNVALFPTLANEATSYCHPQFQFNEKSHHPCLKDNFL